LLVLLISGDSQGVQVLDIPGLRSTSGAFRSALAEMALGLGLDPSYIAAVMAIETGRTFSPSIQNPFTSATGLIQFMPATARAMGTSVDELRRMSAIQQLEYVRDFFRPHVGRIRPNVPGDYYLAVFYPAYIGREPSTVIFSAGEDGYAQNVGLDRNADGVITVGDVTGTVDGVVASAATRPPIEVAIGASFLAWAFGGIVAVLVGSALYQRRRDVRQLVGKYAHI
jgi:hypothetical protein